MAAPDRLASLGLANCRFDKEEVSPRWLALGEATNIPSGGTQVFAAWTAPGGPLIGGTDAISPDSPEVSVNFDPSDYDQPEQGRIQLREGGPDGSILAECQPGAAGGIGGATTARMRLGLVIGAGLVGGAAGNILR